MHLFCDLACVFFDRLYIFFGNVYGRDNTCRVSGVYTGKLNVLHNSRYKCMISVADRICLTFQCVVQETVNQDRTIRSYADSGFHVSFQTFVIVYNFHSATTENVRRTNHNRITDFFCNGKCLFYSSSHSGFWHRNLKFIHHFAEKITVFCKVDNRWRSSEDLHTVSFQISSQVKRCLSAKLCNNTNRFFLFVNA